MALKHTSFFVEVIKMDKPIIVDKEQNLRWEVGTQKCGMCNSDDNIIQFIRNTKRKGLPIQEIAFICKSCAEKEKLIDGSTPITCDSCKKIVQTSDYNGKRYCNDCVNAEEHGEKAND